MRMTIERFLQVVKPQRRPRSNAIRTEYPAFNVTHAVDEDTRIRHYLAEISSLRAELDAARFSINREHGAHRPIACPHGELLCSSVVANPGLYGDGDNLYRNQTEAAPAQAGFSGTPLMADARGSVLDRCTPSRWKDARDRALKVRSFCCPALTYTPITRRASRADAAAASNRRRPPMKAPPNDPASLHFRKQNRPDMIEGGTRSLTASFRGT